MKYPVAVPCVEPCPVSHAHHVIIWTESPETGLGEARDERYGSKTSFLQAIFVSIHHNLPYRKLYATEMMENNHHLSTCPTLQQ